MANLTKGTIVRALLPVEFRLIAYGCAWGLFVGLTSFIAGGDADLAATKGTAGFVAITVGIFIGAKLTLSTMRTFRAWIARLESRLELCVQRVSHITGQADSPEEHGKGSSPLAVRLRIYFVLIGGGFSGAGVGLVQLVIGVGIDIYGSSVYLATLICLVIVLVGVMGTARELMSMGRVMSRIERRLNDFDDAPVVPAGTNPRHADIALESTLSWVYLITGMRGWQPSMTSS